MWQVLASSKRDLTIVGVFAGWLLGTLTLDVGAGIWAQRALGAVSWAVLIGLLRGEGSTERCQVAVVVLFATAVEYAAAPLLGFYTYRLHNVPAFVPPGHGGLYLAALALGRSPVMRLYGPRLRPFVLLAGGSWALWGVTFAQRMDWLGMTLFVLFACVVVKGKAPSVYAATFVLTAALELLGTSLGNWRWATQDPSGLLSIGNPPSGIAGGYCVFDVVALTGGPVLAALLARLRHAAVRNPVQRAAFSPPSAQYLPLPP